jgi:DNA-binding cell septation regulator SpoVG
MSFDIGNIRCVKVKGERGLVGFARFDICGCLHVGNVAIYESCTRKGGYRLVFPNRKLKSGKEVDIFHPYTREAEERIHDAVVGAFSDCEEYAKEDYVTVG